MSDYETLMFELDAIDGDARTLERVRHRISTFAGIRIYIPVNKREKIAKEVGRLFGNGYTRAEVKTSISSRYKISKSSAYRIIVGVINEQ